MSYIRFNEDTRVKIPATIQFLRLGYDYQSMKDAEIDFDTKIFINRFKDSIEKINNKEFTASQIKSILMDIHNVIRNNDLGKELFNWIINPCDKIKLIDLFGSFGISFLSSSKNFFKPLFINLVVIYVAIYNIAKFTNATPTLYFIFCLKASTYCSPISRVCKYSPLNVTAI